MGKYVATSANRRHNKSGLNNYTLTENGISRWLYGEWSEEKLRKYEMLNAVPGIHQYMDYLLDIRADNEYLRRYGMDYSDIHDPRKLRQASSGSSAFGTILNVSKNVAELYL